MILDLHTHLPGPRPQAIISCSPFEIPEEGEFKGQLYSVGIHPWNVKITGLSLSDKAALAAAAMRPDVVAIGETGIDLQHPGAAPLFAQMLAFKAHVELSERLEKPLIIHSVKAQDMIIGVRKDMGAKMPWIIHGFRGKPTVADMYLKAGIGVSFGEKFNAESLMTVPLDMIFAETDESTLTIEEIIAALTAVRPEVSPELIAENIKNLL